MTDILIQFLKTGVILGITVHQTEEEVHGALGEPQGIVAISKKRPADGEIWVYQDLEVTLRDHKVFQILVKLFDGPLDFAPITTPLPTSLTSRTRVEDLLSALDDADVLWTIDRTWTFDRQLTIVTPARVRAFLDLENRALTSISLNLS